MYRTNRITLVLAMSFLFSGCERDARGDLTARQRLLLEARDAALKADEGMKGFSFSVPSSGVVPAMIAGGLEREAFKVAREHYQAVDLLIQIGRQYTADKKTTKAVAAFEEAETWLQNSEKRRLASKEKVKTDDGRDDYWIDTRYKSLVNACAECGHLKLATSIDDRLPRKPGQCRFAIAEILARKGDLEGALQIASRIAGGNDARGRFQLRMAFAKAFLDNESRRAEVGSALNAAIGDIPGIDEIWRRGNLGEVALLQARFDAKSARRNLEKAFEDPSFVVDLHSDRLTDDSGEEVGKANARVLVAAGLEDLAVRSIQRDFDAARVWRVRDFSYANLALGAAGTQKFTLADTYRQQVLDSPEIQTKVALRIAEIALLGRDPQVDGWIDKARKSCSIAGVRGGTAVENWSRIAILEARSGRKDKAILTARDVEKMLPGSFRPDVVFEGALAAPLVYNATKCGLAYYEAGDQDSAKRVLRRAAEIAGKNLKGFNLQDEHLSTRALSLVANSQLTIGEIDDANATFRLAIESLNSERDIASTVYVSLIWTLFDDRIKKELWNECIGDVEALTNGGAKYEAVMRLAEGCDAAREDDLRLDRLVKAARTLNEGRRADALVSVAKAHP